MDPVRLVLDGAEVLAFNAKPYNIGGKSGISRSFTIRVNGQLFKVKVIPTFPEGNEDRFVDHKCNVELELTTFGNSIAPEIKISAIEEH